MARSILLFVFMCGLLLMGACQEGGFFSPITVVSPDQLPRQTAQLVVGSFISPQDTVVRVIVTETTPLNDTIKANPIVTNARVVLIHNRQDSLVLVFDQRGYYQRPLTGTFRLRGGETYILIVSTPDGRRATATCTIPPQAVVIQSLNVDSSLVRSVDVGSTAVDSTLERYAFIRWQDIGGTTYYRVYGLLEQTQEEIIAGKRQSASFIKLLYFYDDSNRSMLTTNKNQEGKIIQSANGVYWRGPYSGKVIRQKITLFLLRTDRTYYDYYQSIMTSQDAASNPFAEPSPIVNNITGGIGCFAGYNGSSISRTLK